jgi:hypothetical protein
MWRSHIVATSRLTVTTLQLLPDVPLACPRLLPSACRPSHACVCRIYAPVRLPPARLPAAASMRARAHPPCSPDRCACHANTPASPTRPPRRRVRRANMPAAPRRLLCPGARRANAPACSLRCVDAPACTPIRCPSAAFTRPCQPAHPSTSRILVGAPSASTRPPTAEPSSVFACARLRTHHITKVVKFRPEGLLQRGYNSVYIYYGILYMLRMGCSGGCGRGACAGLGTASGSPGCDTASMPLAPMSALLRAAAASQGRVANVGQACSRCVADKPHHAGGA